MPTFRHTRGVTRQTVNYFCPVLKGAEFPIRSTRQWSDSSGDNASLTSTQVTQRGRRAAAVWRSPARTLTPALSQGERVWKALWQKGVSLILAPVGSDPDSTDFTLGPWSISTATVTTTRQGSLARQLRHGSPVQGREKGTARTRRLRDAAQPEPKDGAGSPSSADSSGAFRHWHALSESGQ